MKQKALKEREKVRGISPRKEREWEGEKRKRRAGERMGKRQQKTKNNRENGKGKVCGGPWRRWR